MGCDVLRSHPCFVVSKLLPSRFLRPTTLLKMAANFENYVYSRTDDATNECPTPACSSSHVLFFLSQDSWNVYERFAMGEDELAPLTLKGKSSVSFGGLAATLIDSLDTLWMMGMKEEFQRYLLTLETT